MPDILDLSLEEQEDLADDYNAQKIIFESSLAAALRKVFRQMRRDFVAVYSATSAQQDFSIYANDIEAALKPAYRRSSSYFSRHYEREIHKREGDTEEESEFIFALIIARSAASPEIAKQLTEFVNAQPSTQAAFILETTSNVFDKNVQNAIIELSKGGNVPTSAQIAKEAGKNAGIENQNRVGGIAETEVQISSGQGGQVEASVFNDEIVKGKIDTATKKNWISRLDAVTRFFHLDAHGMKREADKPFLVGGELLRFPSDTSLGASLSNIIKCRCIAIYT